MRKMFAIARVAVSHAVRSRVVASLLCLLAIAIVGLPLSIKDDGTLSGHVQVQLIYTLGAVYIILACATVWAGAAAISSEVEERQLHLLVTKPVRCIDIWFGKWMGLVFLNAVLLLACAGVLYSILRWTTREANIGDAAYRRLREEVLVARDTWAPQPPELGAVVEQRAEELIAEGRLPEHVPPDQAVQELERALLREFYAVAPGETRSWRFHPSLRASARDHPALLRARFSASRIGPHAVRGVWRLGTPAQPERFAVETRLVAGQSHVVRFPGTALDPESDTVVSYTNLGREGLTVFFSPDEGLRLETYAGPFETNLLRAIFALLAKLALLAAVGISAGALFSTPIAVFVSAVLTVVIQFSGYIERMAQSELIFYQHTHNGPPAPGIWDHLFRTLFQALNLFVAPLHAASPLELLGAAHTVSWSYVGHALGLHVAVYGGILALVAAALLSRREIGLPS